MYGGSGGERSIEVATWSWRWCLIYAGSDCASRLVRVTAPARSKLGGAACAVPLLDPCSVFRAHPPARAEERLERKTSECGTGACDGARCLTTPLACTATAPPPAKKNLRLWYLRRVRR